MESKQAAQQNLIEQAKTLRDRARLQLHLAGKEAQDEFKKLDQRIVQLERSLEPTAEVARESARDVAEAAGLLIEEIEKWLSKVVESLRSTEKA